jgi:predicted nucleic acid-binding protein
VSKSLLVLDASAAINLLGCGSPEILLDAFEGRCVIEEKTLFEVLYDPFLESAAEPTIERLRKRGSLRVEQMSSEAYLDYLELVSGDLQSALGHGESAALAHAAATQGVVVLDDKKARRVGKAKFPKCKQWTSVHLFREGSQARQLAPHEIGRLVQLALEKARMHVLESDQSWVNGLPGATRQRQRAAQGV